jgi:hypothetical protein
VIYTKDMLDVVRIYAKDISVDRLRLIKLKYAEEILK